MKWREALTAHLVDGTLPRAEGPLAVTQGPVVAVYGLDLVEAGPAIYDILAGSVARVDTVVARASVDHVGALAGDDLVVAAPAFRSGGPTLSGAIIRASTISFLCMMIYKPSTLYIRQCAV